MQVQTDEQSSGEHADWELEDRVMSMVDAWLYDEHRASELTVAEETLLYLLFRQATQPLTPALVTGCAEEFARVSREIQ